MAEHSTLTGAALHEPKGIELASSGTVYVADGSGSGSWVDPLTSVNNLNKFTMSGSIADISTPGSNAYFYIPMDSTLDRLSIILSGAITTANSILSIYRDNILLANTVTVPFAGSGAGVLATATFSPAIAFTAGQRLEVRSDGASDTAARGDITLVFTAS